MLSVLIPSYDWDATELVSNLHKQLIKEQILFELIVFDDASRSVKNIQNEKINKFSNCRFLILEKNIGRSSIRNLLANQSTYDWLLFLDADVIPVDQSLIKKYINEILSKTAKIFVGGIAYKNQNTFKLRWKLGRNVEEKPAKFRNENPYKYLFTGNFLIEKKLFQQIKFEETLTDYGYEDFLFAKELELRKKEIIHLDNFVYHLGIDDNLVFLTKTKKALKNLVFLIENKKINIEETRVSLVYQKLNQFKIISILCIFGRFLEKKTIKRSSLVLYNLFRLTYLHQVFKNRK